MIPCLQAHIGSQNCPECGHSHVRINTLPNRPISTDDVQQLVKKDHIDGILPLFRIRVPDKTGSYSKLIPALIIVERETVQLLWYNLEDETGNWVLVHERENNEQPYVTGVNIGADIQQSAYLEREIEGYEIVKDDPEIKNLNGRKRTNQDSTPASQLGV